MSDQLPETFKEVLDAVPPIADPVLTTATADRDPATRSWISTLTADLRISAFELCPAVTAGVDVRYNSKDTRGTETLKRCPAATQ